MEVLGEVHAEVNALANKLFKPGDTLHLRPRKELVHLFDPQSGRRL